ncbi:hypothetical protein BMT55_09740 [Listeria newyorkensis]|uniref:Alpha-mannosidase n=1 Tax=Listeria newyorkensis TaxID=1497681 RepID=A0ABX4XL71_9LIST|nr:MULTISPECIES: glycoside hydrolase family 38 C-terminal domain-containing protein [Listeria]KGL38150.1 hypothetical protein EP56_16785 [Listeriaceae bacterium FSL A5-0209]KGL39298.1 hypothetical protein EP58_14140 [Listeria newyorkensis]PNP91977.1 hypothetical protein BMT55_09740 [Listeria newyorkensis]RQW66116.1 alpha-mannosidase [Listeria sp. SHR_NRA_18]WAO22245.1 glycoside hydrolase family 38 C-terminal domain-containing protein [Listeria newyorkensis]
MTNEEKIVHVVPHAHWDREWYFTIEDSNVMLIENLRHLMDVLERDEDYKSFVFDAQMSVIEDFLAILPEKKAKLEELITQKRLFVGPWYTQTDTLLVHKESMIRNLLYGSRAAAEMGHSMKIGYLPDIFGQNAYLPSIFQSFGMEYAILQRGLYTDDVATDLNFRWVAPDGVISKANYMYFGYGPGKFLASDAAYVAGTLTPILDTLRKMNKSTSHMLLPAGGDQVLVREHFPETVEALNAEQSDYRFVLSDYEMFMEATWENGEFETVIEGELLASQKSRIHNTIRSQRVDIKLANSRIEDKIYHQLEPLAVMANKYGAPYPKRWLDKVFKLLFDVHAHDSIGGCNSDETNRAIGHRLEQAERICDSLINVLKKQIARGIGTEYEQGAVLVFHLLPKAMTKQVETVIFTKEKAVCLADASGVVVPQTILSQDYISGGKKVVVTADGEREVEIPGYYRTVVSAEIAMEPLSYQVLQIIEGAVNLVTPTADAKITNEFYTVEVVAGKLELTTQSGEQFSNFMLFEDVADDGDSYDFSPLAGDVAELAGTAECIAVKQSELVSEMTIRHTLTRGEGTEIETTLTLKKGEDTLGIKHRLTNKTKNHRIRVKFAAPKSEASYADQAFTAIKRANLNPHFANWRENRFAEAPVPIYPLENFAVSLSDKGAIGVVTQGLKEYEATTDYLALTLFRSVGLLGKDNIAWRPGRASGINNKVVETPDAQMLGDLEFSYHYRATASFTATDWFRATERVRTHQLSYHLQTLNSFEERVERFELPQPASMRDLPTSASLLTISENAFFSALKQAEDGDGIILRAFNPTDEPISIEASRTSIAVNMAELPTNGPAEIAPQSHLTLKMKEL